MTLLYLLDGPAAHTQVQIPTPPTPEYRVAMPERRAAGYVDYDADGPSFVRTVVGVYVPVTHAMLYRYDGVEVDG